MAESEGCFLDFVCKSTSKSSDLWQIKEEACLFLIQYTTVSSTEIWSEESLSRVISYMETFELLCELVSHKWIQCVEHSKGQNQQK